MVATYFAKNHRKEFVEPVFTVRNRSAANSQTFFPIGGSCFHPSSQSFLFAQFGPASPESTWDDHHIRKSCSPLVILRFLRRLTAISRLLP